MASDGFPAGLRVLVVDDDVVCLKVLEQMLRRCSYHVKTCSRATSALNVLRERKDCFDVILSDVHMPDMDGFKLLELVGLEMDLPVIMMSADTSTSAVMRGIRHGACDYLIKPIREEELKNIWQHVVRKKCKGNKDLEHSSSLEDNDRHKRGSDDVEYASSVNEETDLTLKAQRKRGNHTEDDDGELDNDDPATSKKPRVVWSVELHQQFVSAVNQLGHDKAVPKRILELMNVPGLTRENVASHLQKFRLYLRRLSGVAHQQGGIPNSFSGTVESNVKLGSPLGRFDIQSLAASGQIPPQTLAALQAELFGRPAGHLVLPAMDQSAVLQTTMHGSKCIPVEPGVAFSQPLMKFQSNLSKSLPQNAVPLQDVSSALGTWSSNCLGTVGSAANLRGFNTQNGNVMMAMLQQQHQQRQQYQHQQQQASLLPEPNHSVNVQPSCLVVPSQSSVSFQGENSPASFNQNCSLDQSSAFEYSLMSPRPNNSSLSIGHGPVVDLKTGVPNAATAPGSIPPSISSCSVPADSSTGQQVQFSNIGDIKDPRSQSGEVLDQGPLRNLGFVERGTYIPSRFAVDELESPTSNVTHGNISRENDGNRVKREQNLLLLDNVRVGIPTLQKFSPHDVMRVFSE